MKKKQYQIVPLYSCHQQWDELKGSPDKKFCSQCSKHVTNLAGKSNREVIQLIQEGKQCVRLTPSQLEAVYTFQENSQFNFPILKTIAAASLVLATLNTQATSNYNYNSPQLSIEKSIESLKLDTQTHSTAKDSTILTLKGMVINKDNQEELPFANITIVGLDIGTTSDIDGHFTLNIPKDLTEEYLTLQVSYVGYQTQRRKLSVKDIQNGDVNFVLVMSETAFLGMVIIEDKAKRKQRRRIRKWHKKHLKQERQAVDIKKTR